MSKFPLKEFSQTIFYPGLFVIICWGIFLFERIYHIDLSSWGVSPRTTIGLRGILFAPFLHADLNHISSNTLPVLVLGSLIFYFYKPIAWPAILWMYFVAGIWLWIGGRNNSANTMHHLGASILIYAFASFLFFSGVFRKHKPLMVISALVVFLYGSITWAIFPFDESLSWEGHLFGTLSGLLVAYSYRKEGPQKPDYSWDEEQDEEEDEYWNENKPAPDDPEPPLFPEQGSDPFKINYHYIPKQDE